MPFSSTLGYGIMERPLHPANFQWPYSRSMDNLKKNKENNTNSKEIYFLLVKKFWIKKKRSNESHSILQNVIFITN